MLFVLMIVSARVGAVSLSYEKFFAFIGNAFGFDMKASYSKIEEQVFFKSGCHVLLSVHLLVQHCRFREL